MLDVSFKLENGDNIFNGLSRARRFGVYMLLASVMSQYVPIDGQKYKLVEVKPIGSKFTAIIKKG